MTDEQRDFVLMWLSELPEYDYDEAVTQADAWVAWMDGGE